MVCPSKDCTRSFPVADVSKANLTHFTQSKKVTYLIGEVLPHDHKDLGVDSGIVCREMSGKRGEIKLSVACLLFIFIFIVNSKNIYI